MVYRQLCRQKLKRVATVNRLDPPNNPFVDRKLSRLGTGVQLATLAKTARRLAAAEFWQRLIESGPSNNQRGKP
jgi:hypothetical protein